MTFTEVVFELAQREHPLCRGTLDRNLQVVYRCLDTGDVSECHRAHLTIHGADREATDLVRDLRATGDLVEILHQSPHVTGALLEALVASEEPAAAIARLPPLLAHNGLEGTLDPLLAMGGRLRGRVVVPRRVDLAEAARAFQPIQKRAGFEEARVLRAAHVDASLHVESTRRILAPDQEDILAVAASMGYYGSPKAATLSVIAGRLGRSVSPIHKRLKAAEEALVAIHIGAQPPESRPRTRPPMAIESRAAPWEVILRVSRADLGISRFLAQAPGARAHLQALSHTRDASAWMLMTLGDRVTCAKLSSHLSSRADVAASRVVGEDARTIAHTIVGRDRGAFHLPWWGEVWGSEAHLRAIAFEGDIGLVNLLVVRPLTQARLDSRIAETARCAHWEAVETLAVRPLGARAPPEPPGPLTPRQVEVLRVAHALGYYRTPRACTLEKVAATLGVSANAIHKNLVLAESKIIAGYLSATL